MLKYLFIILFLTKGSIFFAAAEMNTTLDIQSLPTVTLMHSCKVSKDLNISYVMFQDNIIGTVSTPQLPKDLQIGTSFKISYTTYTKQISPITNQIGYILKNVKAYTDPVLMQQLPIKIMHSSRDITNLLTQDATKNVWVLDLDDCILQNRLSENVSATVLGFSIENSFEREENKPAGVFFITKRDKSGYGVLDRTMSELERLFPKLYTFSKSRDNLLSTATNNPDFKKQYETSYGPLIIMGDGTDRPNKGETLRALLQTINENSLQNLNFICVDDHMNNCTAYANLVKQPTNITPVLYFYPAENLRLVQTTPN